MHGGAGVIDPAREPIHRAGCLRAIDAARPLLSAGGDALDACCAAVRVLEDDPAFNAGIGAVLDEAGLPALDAAVMRGSDLGYGAIASVVGVRHPIDLARAVLEDGRHCLIVGAGAIALAREKGIALVDPGTMITEQSRTAWEKAREGDTVGAAARDASGAVAVATSTGGTYLRRVGRVGDSPIAGAGTYARRDLGALSATGHGETMMRTVFAYSALLSLSEAGSDARSHRGPHAGARGRHRGRRRARRGNRGASGRPPGLGPQHAPHGRGLAAGR